MLSVGSDNRPPFLYSVGEAFKKYFAFPELFPTLNHAVSSRQQRSERREAVIVTMLALLEFLELSSLRIGIPTEKGFQPLTLDVLQRRTNLHPRRFERAIQNLREAGILKVSDQYKYKHPITKQYIFFPAVRNVNKAFFDVLGFGKRLAEERLAASKRLQKKAIRAGVKFSQMVKYSLENAAAKYKEWREKRQAAINTKLTRGEEDILNQTIRLFMLDGSSYDEARNKALETRAQAARKRRRKAKELHKLLEDEARRRK